MPKGFQDIYDDLYQNAQKDPFGGGEPLEIVEKIPEMLSGGEVLDVGCGMGRHSLYLARKGFHVIAIDTSKHGISKLSERAREESLSIDASQGGIVTSQFATKFDAVIVSFMLHHLPREIVPDIIRRIQDETNSNGVHAIATFTRRGDCFSNDSDGNWYAAAGELQRLYSGWRIVSYEEKVGEALRKDYATGRPWKNISAFLLAQKH